MCFCSKKDLETFKTGVETYSGHVGIKPDQEKRVLYYYGKGDDTMFQTTLKNVGEHWKSASAVATSPAITIGVSYTGKDDFGSVFANAKPTCPVRDLMQMIMRVRHLKDNKLYYVLPTKLYQSLARTNNELWLHEFRDFDSFHESRNQINKEICEAFIQSSKEESQKESFKRLKEICFDKPKTPVALRKILWFNHFETAMSGYYYVKMFYRFLDMCNYKYSILEMPDNNNTGKQLHELIGCDNLIEDNTIERYNAIPDVPDQPELDELQSLVQRKQATEIEKLSIDKFLYEHHCQKYVTNFQKCDLGREHYFFKVWCTSNKTYIEHAKLELRPYYDDSKTADDVYHGGKR